MAYLCGINSPRNHLTPITAAAARSRTKVQATAPSLLEVFSIVNLLTPSKKMLLAFGLARSSYVRGSRLKPIFLGPRFSAGLNANFPLLKQEAPTGTARSPRTRICQRKRPASLRNQRFAPDEERELSLSAAKTWCSA